MDESARTQRPSEAIIFTNKFLRTTTLKKMDRGVCAKISANNKEFYRIRKIPLNRKITD